jgi:hypothetical protein
LRDPTFRFLLVIRVGGRSQIVAQVCDHFVGSPHREMDLCEHEAGIRKRAFTTAKHFKGFWRGATLSNY